MDPIREARREANDDGWNDPPDPFRTPTGDDLHDLHELELADRYTREDHQ